MTEAGTAVGVDIGGTKIAAGVIDSAGTLVVRQEIATPSSDRDALIEAIVGAVGAVSTGHDVSTVGVGIAGLVDADGESVRTASHLPLRDEPLRRTLADALGLPIVVDNDANAGGWAERRFGAARQAPHALYVAVGTGIGGALIVDGRLYRGWQGAAGEIGHLIVERDGRPCPCGSRGCWEQYASGRALVAAAAAAGIEVPHGSVLTAAARDGDDAARALFDELGGWLGSGIASLVAVFDPQVVVVGGGVSEAGDLLMEPTRASFEQSVTARSRRPIPDVVFGELGSDAALIGAADLGRAGRD